MCHGGVSTAKRTQSACRPLTSVSVELLFTKGHCPFNFFRTSKDILPKWTSVLDNAHSVLRFQGWNAPADEVLTGPGCWGYPARKTCLFGTAYFAEGVCREKKRGGGGFTQSVLVWLWCAFAPPPCPTLPWPLCRGTGAQFAHDQTPHASASADWHARVSTNPCNISVGCPQWTCTRAGHADGWRLG